MDPIGIVFILLFSFLLFGVCMGLGSWAVKEFQYTKHDAGKGPFEHIMYHKEEEKNHEAEVVRDMIGEMLKPPENPLYSKKHRPPRQTISRHLI